MLLIIYGVYEHIKYCEVKMIRLFKYSWQVAMEKCLLI